MEQPMKTPTSAELIDELGSLEVRMAQMKPLAVRAKMIRETIQAWMDRRKPNASGSFEGKRYVVQVGPRGNQTQVSDMRNLFEELGKAVFLSGCSFTLRALKEVLPEERRARFVTVTQTGPREVTVTPRRRETKQK